MSFFKIELISDLCASNGESFGSVVDTDIAFDRFGLPVIHGKGLKGCLREIAEELEDCGYLEEGFVDAVFGTAGGKNGALQIYDAHPANYRDLIADIRAHEDYVQNQIFSCYTSVRGQTKIDEDTGKAADGTLRTVRVLTKNRVFFCAYCLPDEYQEGFKACLKALRRIGMHRTRGLGEVRCTPIDKTKMILPPKKQDTPTPKDGFLCYEIETISPLIAAKSFERLPYIPGSTMLGYCFQMLGRNKMDEYLQGGLRVTNAYISDGDKPYYPSPAFLGKQKTVATTLYVFDSDACNALDEPNAKGGPALAYKGANLAFHTDYTKAESLPVLREINYHHKQDDNNVGIIDGKNFYQLSSICAGQKFRGKIYGTDAQLQMIAETLGTQTEVSFGYYRSGGYGQCRLRLLTPNEEQTAAQTDLAAVYLHSAAVLFDENGMPCAKPDAMKAAFQAWLPEGVDIIKEDKQYLRYTDVGGYNATWGMHKQGFQCYGGGTVFVYQLSQSVKLAELLAERPPFLGERTREGYGEFTLLPMDQIKSLPNISLASGSCPIYADVPQVCEDAWKLPSQILAERQQKEFVRKKALDSLTDLKTKGKLPQSDKPVVSKLLLILKEKENDSYEKVYHAAQNIKDNSKRERAKNWAKKPDDVQDSEYRDYLYALLTLAKYKLREGEKAQ